MAWPSALVCLLLSTFSPGPLRSSALLPYTRLFRSLLGPARPPAEGRDGRACDGDQRHVRSARRGEPIAHGVDLRRKLAHLVPLPEDERAREAIGRAACRARERTSAVGRGRKWTEAGTRELTAMPWTSE